MIHCDRDFLELSLGDWYFSVYWHPRVWGFGFHWYAPCCKYWILVGPFEVNRLWREKEYPWEE